MGYRAAFAQPVHTVGTGCQCLCGRYHTNDSIQTIPRASLYQRKGLGGGGGSEAARKGKRGGRHDGWRCCHCHFHFRCFRALSLVCWLNVIMNEPAPGHTWYSTEGRRRLQRLKVEYSKRGRGYRSPMRRCRYWVASTWGSPPRLHCRGAMCSWTG